MVTNLRLIWQSLTMPRVNLCKLFYNKVSSITGAQKSEDLCNDLDHVYSYWIDVRDLIIISIYWNSYGSVRYINNNSI